MPVATEHPWDTGSLNTPQDYHFKHLQHLTVEGDQGSASSMSLQKNLRVPLFSAAAAVPSPSERKLVSVGLGGFWVHGCYMSPCPLQHTGSILLL